MSLQDLASDDHEFFDFIESVTIDPLDAGEDPIPGVPGLRRQLSFDEIHSMSYQIGDVAWHVWADALGGYVPVAGDTLTDAAAQDWTVINCSSATLDTRFRLVCRPT
jgi:hypothetical protein